MITSYFILMSFNFFSNCSLVCLPIVKGNPKYFSARLSFSSKNLILAISNSIKVCDNPNEKIHEHANIKSFYRACKKYKDQ